MELLISLPFLIVAGISDWKKRIIPNQICLALLIIGAIEIGLTIIGIENFTVSISERTMGMLIPAIVLFLIYIYDAKLSGGGDLKLLSSLGLCIGIYNLAFVMFVACIGGIFHVVCKKEKYIPLGTYIMIGEIVISCAYLII